MGVAVILVGFIKCRGAYDPHDLQVFNEGRTGGRYWFSRGWNLRAIGATAIGCALAWGGVVVPALKPLYDYAWFVGFFASGLAHLALAPRQAPIAGQAPLLSD